MHMHCECHAPSPSLKKKAALPPLSQSHTIINQTAVQIPWAMGAMSHPIRAQVTSPQIYSIPISLSKCGGGFHLPR